MIPDELVAIFALLQWPESRKEAREKLAVYSGVESVLFFGKDLEIGHFLPASGQPQTLRDGARWQQFLQNCGRGKTTSLPDPFGNADVVAYGLTDVGATAGVVFLGGQPSSEKCQQVSALLPLLGAKLVVERNLFAAEGHAKAAREASRLASALNGALDVNRRELEAAYQKAESDLASRRIAEAKLRDTDRRKDEFLAMLAHELRNPLAPIAMAAQVLKIGASEPERVQHTCQIIERQVSHMTRLLDDLLDVSRVTGGIITLASELVKMRDIVTEALEQSRPLINARGHSLQVFVPETDLYVTGDATRIVQIVTNLLNNASKYTLPGGSIALTLSADGDDVSVTVRDNGIGIDSELLPHVFDLFVQGERSPDRSQGGLGLGLALVKSLAERHGGTVRASSAGKAMGSEFELTLPRVRPTVASGEAEDSTIEQSCDALSILVVDDNEDAANTLALYLEAFGHDVEATFCGNTALELAEKISPQVLILDIGLPDLDGCQLATKLRALLQTRRSLLIALTGYGHPEDRDRCLAAGFDYHLTKPVDPQELAALLSKKNPTQT